MWRIEKKSYSRNPWRLVNGDGTEVETTCSKTGVRHPVSGQTRAEIESWALDRLEWYARNARAGIIPTIYSQDWRNAAIAATQNEAMEIVRKLALLRDGLDNGNSSAEELAARLAHRAAALRSGSREGQDNG